MKKLIGLVAVLGVLAVGFGVSKAEKPLESADGMTIQGTPSGGGIGGNGQV